MTETCCRFVFVGLTRVGHSFTVAIDCEVRRRAKAIVSGPAARSPGKIYPQGQREGGR